MAKLMSFSAKLCVLTEAELHKPSDTCCIAGSAPHKRASFDRIGEIIR